MSEPISALLKNSSRPAHQDAENSGFIVKLMRGQLNLDAYKKYLINMAWLYAALEKQASTGAPLATTEPIWDSRLDRVESITQDLVNLGVSDWASTTKPTSAMQSYIEHLESLEGRSDLRLVAHHYTRYLGDLSGGQAIAALVARHYQAMPEQLNFYNFTKIDDVVRYKEHYRSALDAIDVKGPELETLVAEVKLAFEFNQKVFEDLDAQLAA
jgi:heme oxygenase